MSRHGCTPHFKRPRIEFPEIKRTKRDEQLAKALAAEIARIAYVANSKDAGDPHPCSLAARTRKTFAKMSDRNRKFALRYSKKLAAGNAGRSEDIDPQLAAHLRRMTKGHLQAIQAGHRNAILEAAKQGKAHRYSFSKTKVGMRDTGDTIATPVRYQQVNARKNIVFVWETNEPGATRVYYELRGPATAEGPGALLAYGIAGNMRNDETVGGIFTLEMVDYFQPTVPTPFQRFTMRVLPLADRKEGLLLQRRYGTTSSNQLIVGEPEPPAGIGPWSPNAVIDYGSEFTQPGIDFDSPVTYYKRVRAKVNWFKVNNDQPGPGDEEYHIKAFFVDFSPLGAALMGKWGTYLPVREGSTKRHQIGWESRDVELKTPATQTWPRFQFMVLSTLEEDSGEGLNDWIAAMAELAEETLRGELEDEINDYLKVMQSELEDATEDLGADAKEATQEYISELIGAAADAAAGALLSFAISMITSFAEAGALDDFYGVETLALTLQTNVASRIEDSSALTLSTSRNLTNGNAIVGQRDGDHYTTKEFEMQLIARSGPDAAGLNGIVSFGVQWEFSGLETRIL